MIENYRTYFTCDLVYSTYPNLEVLPQDEAFDLYVKLVFEKYGHISNEDHVMNEEELARYIKSVIGSTKKMSTLLSVNFMFFVDRNGDDIVTKKELSKYLRKLF